MPVTPLHMGPGMVLKALLGGAFSLMVFGYANVLMDLQPLIALTSGRGEAHGWTHTWLAAVVIGAVAAVTGKWLVERALRLVATADRPASRVRWWVAALSAYLGTLSHIAIDSLMHPHMYPFAPWSDAQPWLGALTVAEVTAGCLAAGAVGAAVLLVSAFLARRTLRNEREQDRADGRVGR